MLSTVFVHSGPVQTLLELNTWDHLRRLLAILCKIAPEQLIPGLTFWIKKRLLLLQGICISTVYTQLLKQGENSNVPHKMHTSNLILFYNSDCSRENVDFVHGAQKSLKTWSSNKGNLWCFHSLVAWISSCLKWYTTTPTINPWRRQAVSSIHVNVVIWAEG